MGAIAVPFCLDALYGMFVLFRIFRGRDSFKETNLIESNSSQWKSVEGKNFNNRLPQILTEGKVAEKMFTKGWKFNMFNVQGQF
jgi:hypothetical protein